MFILQTEVRDENINLYKEPSPTRPYTLLLLCRLLHGLRFLSKWELLNDFYYELGLDGTKMGDMLGWNIDEGYIDLAFSSQLDANGTPCLVIDYQVAPVYDYQ